MEAFVLCSLLQKTTCSAGLPVQNWLYSEVNLYENAPIWTWPDTLLGAPAYDGSAVRCGHLEEHAVECLSHFVTDIAWHYDVWRKII